MISTKDLLLVLFIFCYISEVTAQEKRSMKISFFNSTGVCFLNGVGNFRTVDDEVVKNNESLYSISSINGIQLNHNYFGLGLGIDKWGESILFPVFVNYRLTLYTMKEIVFYGFFDV